LTIQKNEIKSFGKKVIELEIIMLSEISQTEKDKYLMFSLMRNLGIFFFNDKECKMGTVWGGEPVGQSKRRGQWKG
jgi:hypothetical protein